MKNMSEAIKQTDKIVNEALDKIDELPEEEFKEAKQILDILKENLAMWEDMDELKMD